MQKESFSRDISRGSKVFVQKSNIDFQELTYYEVVFVSFVFQFAPARLKRS